MRAPAIPQAASKTPAQNQNSEGFAASSIVPMQGGVPAIQYTFVDPDQQYQKYISVLVQNLSGTDPLKPPNFDAKLVEGGNALELTVPVSPVLSSTELLVSSKVAWMQGGSYEAKRQTRLGGLGPAIAKVANHFQGQSWNTKWKVPLVESCDDIVGSYSITNFPTKTNSHGQKHYPVIMEFLLKLKEQSVKTEKTVNVGIWQDSDDEDSTGSHHHLAKKARRHNW